MHYAHSTDDPDRAKWHLLADHLREVGRLAGERGHAFGAGRAAALAGRLHDLGKYSTAFQRRLGGAIERVDHSTAGAREVMQLAASPKDRLMAELVAYAIAGHHAGLADKEGETGSLSDRLNPKVYRIEPLDAAWKTEVEVSASDLFPPELALEKERSRAAFQLGFLGRMIFSCLVDADYRDTEAFFARAEGTTVDREWSPLSEIVDDLRARFDSYMEHIRAKAPDTLVNSLRDEILAHVRGKAGLPRGVFTLNVPTGGGKTLASLGFALDHAKAHGMRRIITAIPFTSVIDQTAAIFREVLGENVVLEHHSAIDEERLGERQGRDKLRLAMEDWAAPVVVTTNVQLFESLFSNRPSRCRKLHNLANAVIVLDEAQTIPLHVLRPSVAALNELVRNYGCTIVLCTATQPALSSPEFDGGFGLTPERELAPDPPALHAALRRTTLRVGDVMSDDDVVAALRSTEQALVIVNSRAHALALYRTAKDAGIAGAIHLTTRQTAADRREILADAKRLLGERNPCRLIATSLVECGVDFDFPRVWRAEAGLDQIAQAAGRCNREGGRPVGDSIVTIFKPAEAKPPREIAGFTGDMARIAHKHGDLLAPEAMRDYFGEVYWRKGDGLDTNGVLPTSNKPDGSFRISAGITSFDYRTVAENFRLIETGLLPVIVAESDEPKRVIEGLRGGWLTPGAAARKLQSHVVQIPPKARAKLVANGHVRFESKFGDQFAVLTTGSLYSNDVGLLWEDAEYLGSEQFIV